MGKTSKQKATSTNLTLFNQPGLFTHYVEYEVYRVSHHIELNSQRTDFKRINTIHHNERKWICSRVMEFDKIDNFLACFVTGCTHSSGQYKIVQLEKAVTESWHRPKPKNEVWTIYDE